MHWFKRNPVFGTILTILGLILAAQVVVLVLERNNLEQVRRSYESKVFEYERLLNHSPSLTRENLDLVVQDRRNVEDNLASIKAALGAEADVADFFGVAPATSQDAFFDLQNFLDAYRERARQVGGEEGEGVRLRDNESFGFSRYGTRGPPSALIEDVHKQRRIAEFLLDTLFEARPVELVRIRREDVAERRGIDAPGGGDREDIFTIPETMSARIPGFVETYAFQLTFTGYTATLRDFLNRLSAFEVPVLVRGVEVVPANGAGSGTAATRERRIPVASPAATEAAGEDNGAVPIVTPHLSRFVVTVEYIELVSPEDADSLDNGVVSPEIGFEED